jgi:radical SAM protein with 4Fe4S-binding SPASM domain
LREDFVEVYLFARKLGLKVLLFTNATLISPHIADLFARIPPLEKVEVSLYGMRKKSYEAITRIPGSFKAAWRGINLLLENNIPFVVKSALLPSNKKKIDEFESWASTIPWMDGPPSYSMLFDLRCRKDSEEKNSLIRGLRVSPEEMLEVLVRRGEGFLNEMKAFCSKFVGTNKENLFSCGTGIGGGCIDAYGYFQPCMMLRHPMTIYNLKNGSIKDAVTNFFPKVRKMRAKNSDYIARCDRCFLRGLCEQCPAMSWMEHGTLDTPVEYFCRIAHVKARYLGLLQKNEKGWEVNNWKKRIIDFSGEIHQLARY